MSRPNRHTYRERLFDAQGQYDRRVAPEELQGMLARGEVERHYEQRGSKAVFVGYRPKFVPASSADTSPASITLSECQLNAFARADVRNNQRNTASGRKKDELKDYERAAMRKVDRNTVIVENKEIVAAPSWLYRGKQQGYGVSHG